MKIIKKGKQLSVGHRLPCVRAPTSRVRIQVDNFLVGELSEMFLHIILEQHCNTITVKSIKINFGSGRNIYPAFFATENGVRKMRKFYSLSQPLFTNSRTEVAQRPNYWVNNQNIATSHLHLELESKSKQNGGQCCW